MNHRQKAFVRAYLGEANGNGTQAAILAGYSKKTARQMASDLLTNPSIADALKTFAGAADISTDRAMRNIGRIANTAIQDAERIKVKDILNANELILKVNGALHDKQPEPKVTVHIGFLSRDPRPLQTIDVIAE